MDRLSLAFAQILTPASLARAAAYREHLRVLREERGEAFVQLWILAQRWLRHDGRVKEPPRGWDFLVALGAARANRMPPAFTDVQLLQWREFWDWYLPVEGALLRLIELLHGLSLEDEMPLLGEVCGKALVVHAQYQRWLADGTIAWLPVEREDGPRRSIVEKLGRAINRFNP